MPPNYNVHKTVVTVLTAKLILGCPIYTGY